MTETKAELLLASKNSATGVILFTFRLTFPRIILAETLTHRVASRNTSSSRAITILKMLKAVLYDPFIPVSLGKNKKGMQATEEVVGWRRTAAFAVIRLGRYPAMLQTWLLSKLGVHKQVANRYLEPWSWCTQIFSATEVDNLFKLRNHDAAEPHFHILAAEMQAQAEWASRHFYFEEMLPGHILKIGLVNLQILKPGQWHLPLIDPDLLYATGDAKRISAAGCGRTSFTLIGTGRRATAQEDIDLCQSFIDNQHLSPTEHPAQAMEEDVFSGNFRSFRQFRKEVEVG